jgi:DNA-binding IclR family transcriptional regulator
MPVAPDNPKPSRSETSRRGASSGGEKARSLVRGLAILKRVSDLPGQLRPKDIIREFKMPRASVYQLLGVLVREGFLSAAPMSGCFTLGIQSYRLGIAYQANTILLREARDVLRGLRDDSGETVQLSILDKDMNVVVLREDGHGRLTFLNPVGAYLPVNWSASGSLLVSDWTDSALRARLPAIIKKSPTGRAPMDVDTLIKEIRRFRAQGFAIRVSSAHEKLITVAAPIVDIAARCIAAITLVIYEPTLTQRRQRILIQMVRSAAKELSGRINSA